MSDTMAGKLVLQTPDFKSIKRSMDEFWRLAKELRKELGVKEYYLEQYLDTVFQMLDKIDLIGIANLVQDISYSISRDCEIVCKSQDIKKKSEFYDIVKNYVDKHPLNIEYEQTKYAFYTANILINNLELFSQKFQKDYEKSFNPYIDLVISDGVYEKITDLIEKKRMIMFNDLIKRVFIFCPIINHVTQQILIQALSNLIYRDPVTSKQVYRLIMEENLK